MLRTINKRPSSILCLILAVGMAFTWAVPTSHATESAPWTSSKIHGVVQETGNYMQQIVTSPAISSIGGEWAVLGLARSGASVSGKYYDDYYTRVVQELTEEQGKLTSTKYTEYSRLILALTSIGKDVQTVGGYNLLEKLADYNQVIKQGVNGPIFALIALDSHAYEIPVLSGVPVQTTRDKLIQYILLKEIVTEQGVRGGFALTGTLADPDLTGMAFQALAPYRSKPEVEAAIQRAITAISRQQLTNGGFMRWGTQDSETLAQMITGLCALGIDPSTDPNFVKVDSNGRKNSLVDALMEYQLPGGGFRHVMSQEENQMATEQSFYALTALDRLLSGKSSLYDMKDVTIGGIRVTLDGRVLGFDQPPVNVSGRVLVPLRAIFQEMGAVIQWDQSTQTVTATKGTHTIVLTIGSSTATVDGVKVTLDVPGKLINNRTMVPVRFIAQGLSAKVDWSQATQTVIITQ